MNQQADGLTTIQDFIRWGASRFSEAGLFFGHGTDNPYDEAIALVLHALHLDPYLPVEYRGCALTSAEHSAVVELLLRRISERKPAAYLTGRAWFAGLELAVDDRVLVPRSPIAELIDAHFEPWVQPESIERVLDLCTGGGCIGLATAAHLPGVSVDLVDLSPAALEVARENRERLDLVSRVRLIESDLFAGLDDDEYDLIISNPPYVSRAEYEALPAEYLAEPRLGLEGGESGLELVLRILRDAPDHLADEGVLVVEVGFSAQALERQFPEVPFMWIDFERGGEGVFVMRRDELNEYHSQFAEALAGL